MPTNDQQTLSGKPRKSNAGRKRKPGAVAKTFNLEPDVVAILSKMKNATRFVEDACRFAYTMGQRN